MTEAAQDQRRHALAVTEDPRAARTRDRIIGALDALLATGDAVSVGEVCARAGVGRSTFYTHFATVGDVVVHVVDGIFDELSARDVFRRTTHAMQRDTITRTGLRELLDAFRDRRLWFRYALSAPATERVRERLTDEMSVSLRRTIRAERPDAPEAFIRTSSEYITGGVFGVLLGWLDDDAGRSDAEVVNLVTTLLPTWLTGENP